MQVVKTNNPAMQKPNPKCPRCNRHTMKQIDDRTKIPAGEQRYEPFICVGCLVDMNHCKCEDWIED